MRSLPLALLLALSAGAAAAADVQSSRPPKQAIIVPAKPEQLTSVPQPPPPPEFKLVPGVIHRDDAMNPSDPADQQQNQSHGLMALPGDDVLDRFYGH